MSINTSNANGATSMNKKTMKKKDGNEFSMFENIFHKYGMEKVL